MSQKIAVIGGGIAGLTSAYLLHQDNELTMYEKASRVGGNAYTLKTSRGESIDVSVFAFGRTTYPNFFRLLDELGVSTQRLQTKFMHESMMDLDTKYHWTLNLSTLNPVKIPKLVRMIQGIRTGIKMLDAGKLDGLTTREAASRIKGFEGMVLMRTVFFLCLAASMSYEEVMNAPAGFFFGKIKKHFNTPKDLASFRFVQGHTQTYIQAIAKLIKDRIVLRSRIRSVSRSGNGVTLHFDDNPPRTYDKVIFACNADEALALLQQSTDREMQLLGAWRYNNSLAVVHRDDSQFPPKNKRYMYTYLYTHRKGQVVTSLNASYRFQAGVPKDSPYVGTMFPNIEIDPALIEFTKVFRTPIFDAKSFGTITQLPELNGVQNTYYCGSHFGFGLHEDAVRSAVEVARSLGATWEAGTTTSALWKPPSINGAEYSAHK